MSSNHHRWQIDAVARHSETLEPLVAYRPLHGDTGWWVRLHVLFFERIEVDRAQRGRAGRPCPTTPWIASPCVA